MGVREKYVGVILKVRREEWGSVRMTKKIEQRGRPDRKKDRPEVLCYLYSQLQVQSYNTLYPACHLLSFSISKSPKNRSLTNRHSTPYKLWKNFQNLTATEQAEPPWTQVDSHSEIQVECHSENQATPPRITDYRLQLFWNSHAPLCVRHIKIFIIIITYSLYYFSSFWRIKIKKL